MIKKGYIKDISEYLRKNLKKGYTRESLKWALVNQGYPKIEVEKALHAVDEQMAAEAPILKAKPEINVEVVEPEEPPKKSFWKRIFG
ncbi:MAG: hypothetical protein MUF61_02475 [archaeon]|jgi:hypothetical protein|nr:hypothetical protein [archaeon]